MLSRRTTGGIAHRAREIARRGDLDQANTGVLLMLTAESAIVGAPFLSLRPENFGDSPRDIELHAIVLRDIRANEILPNAVRGALLAKVDPPLACNDLRGHNGEAIRAEALRHS